MDEFNVGDRVVYTKTMEDGVVSSKNDEFIFVKYYRNGVLMETEQATYPRDLVSIDIIRQCSDENCKHCDYHTLEYDEYGFSEPNSWHCAYRLQYEDELGIADDKPPCVGCNYCDYFNNPEFYNKEVNGCSKYYGDGEWR
jgi:hypothetical protein